MDIDNIDKEYLKFVDKTIKSLRIEKIAEMLNTSFLKYVEIARNPRERIDMLDTLKVIALSIFVIVTLFQGIPNSIVGLITAGFGLLVSDLGAFDWMFIGISVILPLFFGVATLIGASINGIIEYILIMLSGKSKTLKEHLRLSLGNVLLGLVLTIPFLIIGIITNFLSIIPLIQCILILPLLFVGLLELAVTLYILYLRIVMYKEYYDIGTLHALGIIILAPITVGIIAVVILFIVALIVFGINLLTFI